MRRALSREAAAFVPWIIAGFVWFGWIGPMRVDQADRLLLQSQSRRDRLKADRASKIAATQKHRISTTLAATCRASADPAALRQRAVAASAGLPLSPLSLSVMGGAGGGATVDAEGSKGAILELLRRLGDPAHGGFLRTVALRERSGRWNVSSSTGVLDTVPRGLMTTVAPCDGGSDLPNIEPSPVPTPAPIVRVMRPRPTPTPEVMLPAPEPTVEPPFSLIGFLSSGGKVRVSIRARDQVRVVSAGDLVDGWRCVSVDRDEGAVFTAPGGERFVLKAGPREH
ncbi:MAG: hypothetical protein ABI672_16095 [Vicinamibacteria bacterium]